MQLIQLQQLLAKAHITVHLVKILMNCLNQIQIHIRRHLRTEQSSFKCIFVMPGLGKKLQLFVLGVQKTCRSIFEAGHGVVELFIGIPAQLPVRTFLQGNKGTVGKRVLLPCSIYCVRECQVCIVKGTENVIGCIRHLAGCSQKFFLCSGQGMGFHAPCIGQIATIAFQRSTLCIKTFQLPVGNGHNFRRIKTTGSCNTNIYAHKLAGHSLVLWIPGILVRSAHGIAGQFFRFDRHLLNGLQKVTECLSAFCQPSCKVRQYFPILIKGFQFRFPEFIGSIQILNRPLILRRDLFPTADAFDFFHQIFLPVILFLLYHTHQKIQRRLQFLP